MPRITFRGVIKIARISLIVTAFLALPAVATAADLTGPTLADAPATAPACKPGRNTICGPSQTPKLDAAVAGYAATLSSDKTRRGLGLPTLRQLFGKAGARAQALADGRLTGPAPKTARAAAAGGLGTVATVGHVSVEATPAPGLGAGVDEITYTDQIKGPGGKQMRSIRFNVTADACPVAASGAENVGRDMGHMLVAEHIVTVQRSGRLELTTDFTIDTTNTQNIWGTVKGNSDLATIDSNLPAYVRIRRVRTARDLRTGKRYREKPVELDYEMNEISPLWMFGDAFDKFIDKYANANDDNPADAVVSDRLLNEDAFEAAARTFMTAVEAKTRSIFEAAETQWKTPNRCVDMKSDVPAELVPGQSVNVHVSATSKRGDPAANLRSYAHYVPYKSAGLTVDPFAPASPDENMASDFKVTPPSQPWPDSSPERLRIILFSTGGIGEIDTDFKAQTLPFRYRVLHAAYSVKSSGSMPGGLCASFGGTSGTTALTGESSGDPLEDPANKIDGIGGALFGQIYGQVRDGITQVLQGCELNSQAQKIPCSMSGSSQLPNTRATGFNIAVPDPKSGTATVHWLILSPGIGGPTLPCDVMIWAPVPYDKSTVTVPMSTFLSKEPQTLTFSDSMHSDQDGLGKPASIDYTWSYSVTFQRI